MITPWLEKATSDSVYLAGTWAESDGYLPLLRDAFNITAMMRQTMKRWLIRYPKANPDFTARRLGGWWYGCGE